MLTDESINSTENLNLPPPSYNTCMNTLLLPLNYSIHISPLSLNENISNTNSVQPNSTVCPQLLHAVEDTQTAPNIRENNDILRRIKQEMHIFCRFLWKNKYLFLVLIYHLFVISIYFYLLFYPRDVSNAIFCLKNVIFFIYICSFTFISSSLIFDFYGYFKEMMSKRMLLFLCLMCFIISIMNISLPVLLVIKNPTLIEQLITNSTIK